MKFFSNNLLAAAAVTHNSIASAWVHQPSSSLKSRAAATTSTSLGESTAVDNVILRPSADDPERFDSLSIGHCRVHRYARDIGGDPTDSEYVLWYHGRDRGLNAEANALPPLSTGRIGRATSRNGLVWEKCNLGSGSETKPAVSLGLNEESWCNFDTAHVGLGQVMLPMSTPAVISEGGVYLMYYCGGTHEETLVSSYLDDPTAVPDDATIKGMNLRIGIAMSQDGLTWGRVEGDDPTGAMVVPFDSSDPNQRWMTAEAGYKDEDGSIIHLDEELYCGWPEVVVHYIEGEDSPPSGSGKTKPPAFHMYYSTMLKDSKTKAIGFAVSEDGFRWLKRGTCLRPSDDGMDDGGCARCNVVRNQQYDADRGLWQDTEGWTMYYEGVSLKDGKHRIMAAESLDGRDWKKLGVVMDVGKEADGGWDFNGVGSPQVLRCVIIFFTNALFNIQRLGTHFFFTLYFLSGWKMGRSACIILAREGEGRRASGSPRPVATASPSLSGSRLGSASLDGLFSS